MNRRWLFLRVAVLLASAPLSSLMAGGVWRSYEIYQPTVTHHDVIDGRTHPHKYNHCASIAWFQDRWFCLWGSNTPPEEHAPGQRVYFSTGPDGKTWSPIKLAFSSSEHSGNPVAYPDGKGHQWQPNLALVGNELWALWNQGGSVHDFREPGGKEKDLRGVYFSRLESPNGKWINRRLEWEGSAWPVVDGKSWYLASTQNPYRLRSGRVTAPVTLYAMKGKAADAPSSAEAWWGVEKRNSVIYTDDLGKTWRLSKGCTTPGFSWIQWEPTVWEQPDGTVLMFARNNTNPGLGHGNLSSGQYLLWSESKDGGETWTPHKFVPLETVCSRMHVAPLDGRGVWDPAARNDDFSNRRYAMVHNDAPGALLPWSTGRRNLALFFARGGGIDFIAGNSLTGLDPEVAYPQIWRHGDALAVCYTQAYTAPRSRSIRVALVSPIPTPDRYYLFPRSNDVAPGSRPQRLGPAWSFHREQHIATRSAVNPGERGFSFGAWLRPRAPGVIFDCRASSPTSGFVVLLRTETAKTVAGKQVCIQPVVSLVSPNEEITGDLPVPLDGQWHYLGVTVDNQKRQILFSMDGKTATLPMESVHPLKGDTARLGFKRPAHSKLSGFAGEIRFAALYSGAQLGVTEHAWLHNRFAKELECRDQRPAMAPRDHPELWMDPADETAFQREFALSTDTEHGGSEAVLVDGLRALRFRDQGSAGVDLDENDRTLGDKVSLRFRFRIEAGESHTLCTVGDVNQPARLITHDGQIFLTTGKTNLLCGNINKDGWTGVALETARDRTTATVDHGTPVTVRHQPVATWLYLSEGFPDYGKYPGNRWLLDIGSVQTCVERLN